MPSVAQTNSMAERGWWLRRAPAVFAVALSLFVHMAILSWAAEVVIQGPPAEAGDDAIALAILTETELTEQLQAWLQGVEQTVEPLALADAFTVSELPSLSFNLLEAGPPGSLLDLSGAGRIGRAAGGLELAMGGGSAKFFGVEARGSRFAYIVDVSSSMHGSKMEVLKEQLIASISGLLQHAHLAVYLYNNRVTPVRGMGWHPAKDHVKQDFYVEIMARQTAGGTKPLPAFEQVFNLQPRPDAIYFMTDGEFYTDAGVIVAIIARMNREGRDRVPIHCITYLNDQSAAVMRRIAQDSGGSYRHIEAAGGTAR